MRRSSFLFLFICIEQIHAQSLLSILQSTPGTLSTLNSLINSSTQLRTGFAAANNFTFLAPSNNAFKKWFADQGTTSPSRDVIDATLTYHLISGGFPTVLFSSVPRFVSSVLKTPAFANVSTGQTVEMQEAGKKFKFLSGTKTVSTVTSADIVCTGGIIHVIDTVLDIPQDLVSVITKSNLTFFIGILNQGNYLNAAARPLLLPILNSNDVTFFAPNTASALSKFTSVSKGASRSQLGEIFNYHAIPNFLGYSSSLNNGMVLKTVQGKSVTITVRGNDTYVNQAKIIKTDFLVANGVMHTIDSLLDQNNITTPPLASEQPAQPAQTHTPSPQLVPNKTGLSTGLKIGIILSSITALLLLITLTFFYIHWFKQRLHSPPSPLPTKKISGPYSQELGSIGGGTMDLHGYREDELLDTGSRRESTKGFVVDAGTVGFGEDKRRFEVFAAELDAREKSWGRSRRGSMMKGESLERNSKRFF